jgi:hypothetical protein
VGSGVEIWVTANGSKAVSSDFFPLKYTELHETVGVKIGEWMPSYRGKGGFGGLCVLGVKRDLALSAEILGSTLGQPDGLLTKLHETVGAVDGAVLWSSSRHAGLCRDTGGSSAATGAVRLCATRFGATSGEWRVVVKPIRLGPTGFGATSGASAEG